MLFIIAFTFLSPQKFLIVFCRKLLKNLKEFLIINLIVFFLMVLSGFLNFRICLIYNIFKIPSPGCGMTRALYMLLNGHFLKSLRYNFLFIIVLLFYIIFIIWNLLDYKFKKNTFSQFTNKYKYAIFVFFLILVIVQ